jgi:hypothetical protein
LFSRQNVVFSQSGRCECDAILRIPSTLCFLT